jgi:hypothetical protein
MLTAAFLLSCGVALLLYPALDVPLSEASVAAATHGGESASPRGAVDPAPRHAQALGDIVRVSQAFGHIPYTDERGRVPLFAAHAA